MGDYSDYLEDGQEISLNPKDWLDSFHQSDIFTCDMEIIGVRIENELPPTK